MVASKCTRPAQVWASRAQASGAPISSDTAWAISSARSLYKANMRRSSARRVALSVRVKAGKAARAAATALSTSAALPMEIWV